MFKNSKTIYVIIIVIIFVFLGIWYLGTTSNTTNTRPVITTNPITNNQPTTTTPTSTTLSSDKSINSFNFLGLNPEVDGSVDNVGYQVNLIVPNGTDITNLIPTISISDNATIYPNSGTVQNFTNPVIYTVTAQDGSIEDYTVTVTTQATVTE